MTIWEFAEYSKHFLTVAMGLLMLGYIYHLYRSQQTGRRDYEKYSNLVLDDEISSKPLEKFEKKEKKEEA